jgi:hypothetical protein
MAELQVKTAAIQQNRIAVRMQRIIRIPQSVSKHIDYTQKISHRVTYNKALIIFDNNIAIELEAGKQRCHLMLCYLSAFQFFVQNSTDVGNEQRNFRRRLKRHR